MPTFLIVLASIIGFVVAVFSAGFGLVASADAEGRGGDYVLGGMIVALIGAASFLGFGIWALVRWLA